MNKLFPILALLFFSCDEDNPVASLNNKIPLNWAVVGSDCYFTDENNKCQGHTTTSYYGTPLLRAYQFQSLELINITDNGEYVVEKCNRVMPPVLEESDITNPACSETTWDTPLIQTWCVVSSCFDEDDGFQNFLDYSGNNCYQHNYAFNESGCNTYAEFEYVQYK